MSVWYYFLNLLWEYDGWNNTFLTSLVVCKHAIITEDKILVKNVFELKGYNAKHVVRKFPSKGWNVGLAYKLLQKLRITGSVDRRPCSGRWHSACTADNIDLLDQLMLHKIS